VAVSLAPSATRYYKVSAVTTGDEGPKSNERANRVNPKIKGYSVYRDGQYVTEVSTATTPDYTDTTLTPNTSGVYEIKAISTDDLEGAGSGTMLEWTKANIPGAPAVTGDWDSTDLYHCDIVIDINNNSPITEYAVTIDSGGFETWWVQNDGYLGASEYWTASTNWISKGLKALTTYYYKVKARNGEGLETIILSSAGLDQTPPVPKPDLFKVLDKGLNNITWGWMDNSGSDEEGFRVYNATAGIMLQDLGPDTTFWPETGLTENTLYERYVKAYVAGGETDPSNTDKCYTLIQDPAGVSFDIHITSMDVNAVGTYTNINKSSSGILFTNLTTAGQSDWISATTWPNAGLNPNTFYNYSIKARNGDAIETTSISSGVYTLCEPLAAPSIYAITDASFKISINEGNNPAWTKFCIKVLKSGTTKYVQADYTLAVSSEVYQTEAAWGEIEVTGLTPMTKYEVAVKAKNEEEKETLYSPYALDWTKGLAPTVEGKYDTTFLYHLYVHINPGTNPPGTEYAIKQEGGDWLKGDGNGGTDTSEVWKSTTDWEQMDANLHSISIAGGTEYSYMVKAKLPTLEEIESAIGSAFTPPPAPTVDVEEINNDYLKVDWNAVLTATSYHLFYATASDGQYIFKSTITATVYNDYDLEGGIPYKVTGATLSILSANSIQIGWNSVSISSNSIERYYKVRGLSGSGSGALSTFGSGDYQVTPAVSVYRVYRNSIYIGGTTETTYVDTQLSPETEYTYKVKAVSSEGKEGEQSDEVAGKTFPDLVAPLPPGGIKIISQDSQNIKFKWNSVKIRENRTSAVGKINGYYIYRLLNTWEEIGFVSEGSTLEYEDTHGGVSYYYAVKTIDIYNVKSSYSMKVQAREISTIIGSDEDMNLKIVFENEDKEYLYKETNEYAQDLHIQATKTGDKYDIKALKVDTGELAENIKFNKTLNGPKIMIKVNSPGGSGAMSASAAKKAVYWHNGVEWVRVGGYQEGGYIWCNFKRLGSFRVQDDTGDGILSKVAPKIFSPNETDPFVNTVRFSIRNPENKTIRGEIYDVRGRLIKEGINNEGTEMLIWDGRNDSDELVSSGIYIYQIKVGSEVKNGVIIVAK
jgi:hypothetical protein